eukprot:scaffold78760_cov34-Prasinocladus_malaysianus.AAC.1
MSVTALQRLESHALNNGVPCDTEARVASNNWIPGDGRGCHPMVLEEIYTRGKPRPYMKLALIHLCVVVVFSSAWPSFYCCTSRCLLLCTPAIRQCQNSPLPAT